MVIEITRCATILPRLRKKERTSKIFLVFAAHEVRKGDMDYKLRDKRTWVKGLMVDCPMGTALEDCPAGKIRSLPVRELVRIVNSLSEKQLDDIIECHEECITERQAAF